MKIDITITDTTTTITWSTSDYYDYEQLQSDTSPGVSREILRVVKKILKKESRKYLEHV